MSRNTAASIKARLLDLARAQGEEFERTLTRYAAERLLYRLGQSTVGNRCILKGASLLAVWIPEPWRATRDVDLLLSGASDDASIRELLETICAVPCEEDALLFELSGLKIGTIRPGDSSSGVRARFKALLGSASIGVQLDFGTGDALGAPPVEITYPVLLKDLNPPRMLAYPREVTIAEKFEAILRFGTRNSRMKDFHDIWALSSVFDFAGPILQNAVSACLNKRNTPREAGLPHPFTPAFYMEVELQTRWRSYQGAGNVIEPPPLEFARIGGRITEFLAPVWASIQQGTILNRHWTPGGPWSGLE